MKASVLTIDGRLIERGTVYTFDNFLDHIFPALKVYGGMLILEDPEYGKELEKEFQAMLSNFQSFGEGFDSRHHRGNCITEIHDYRDHLEAQGVPVMSEAELWKITGDI